MSAPTSLGGLDPTSTCEYLRIRFPISSLAGSKFSRSHCSATSSLWFFARNTSGHQLAIAMGRSGSPLLHGMWQCTSDVPIKRLSIPCTATTKMYSFPCSLTNTRTSIFPILLTALFITTPPNVYAQTPFPSASPFNATPYWGYIAIGLGLSLLPAYAFALWCSCSCHLLYSGYVGCHSGDHRLCIVAQLPKGSGRRQKARPRRYRGKGKYIFQTTRERGRSCCASTSSTSACQGRKGRHKRASTKSG